MSSGSVGLANALAFWIFYRHVFKSGSGRMPVVPACCMSTYRKFDRCAKEWGSDHTFTEGYKKILIKYCRAVDDGNSLIVDVEMLRKVEKMYS